MFTRFCKVGVCAALATAAITSVAQADDLLIVDLSVANQVSVFATSGLSAATVTGSDSIGVYFDNFYGAAGGSLTTTSTGAGDLTNVGAPSDGSPALFRGGSGSDTGLNIFSWSNDSNVTFTAGTQAFTGSGTWALDAPEYADMLNGNTSGNLYFPADTFDDVGGATAIGTYRVIVPAPAALPMLGMGLMGAMRRRR